MTSWTALFGHGLETEIGAIGNTAMGGDATGFVGTAPPIVSGKLRVSTRWQRILRSPPTVRKQSGIGLPVQEHNRKINNVVFLVISDKSGANLKASVISATPVEHDPGGIRPRRSVFQCSSDNRCPIERRALATELN
jgi:hypothetical protein